MSREEEANARLFRLLPGDDQFVAWQVAKLACESAIFNAVSDESVEYQLRLTMADYRYPAEVFQAL